MFPPIIKEINKRIKQYKKDGEEFVFVDCAVLFSSGLYKKMDSIVLVEAPLTIRLDRLVKSRKINIEVAKKQVEVVKIAKEDIKKCDYIIYNIDYNKTRQKLFNILINLGAS